MTEEGERRKEGNKEREQGKGEREREKQKQTRRKGRKEGRKRRKGPDEKRCFIGARRTLSVQPARHILPLSPALSWLFCPGCFFCSLCPAGGRSNTMLSLPLSRSLSMSFFPPVFTSLCFFLHPLLIAGCIPSSSPHASHLHCLTLTSYSVRVDRISERRNVLSAKPEQPVGASTSDKILLLCGRIPSLRSTARNKKSSAASLQSAKVSPAGRTHSRCVHPLSPVLPHSRAVERLSESHGHTQARIFLLCVARADP